RIQERDAQGNWSVVATGGDALGQVDNPTALAVDVTGELYVADWVSGARIQKRDARGNWSVIATFGTDFGRSVGEVYSPTALAVDGAGHFYGADKGDDGQGNYGWRIQRRDGQGVWSLIATEDQTLGQVYDPTALAVDAAGNLYVADSPYDGTGIRYDRIQ